MTNKTRVKDPSSDSDRNVKATKAITTQKRLKLQGEYAMFKAT